MKTKNKDIIMKNTLFLWIAIATGLILMIPLFAMQFTNEVNWTLSDFIVAGILLSGTSSMYVLAARKFRNHRVVVGIIFTLAFLWLWVELAVGLFTNWGS